VQAKGPVSSLSSQIEPRLPVVTAIAQSPILISQSSESLRVRQIKNYRWTRIDPNSGKGFCSCQFVRLRGSDLLDVLPRTGKKGSGHAHPGRVDRKAHESTRIKPVLNPLRVHSWFFASAVGPIGTESMPTSGDGLKNLFLRVQAGIFSDRAQPAPHPEL
jgi:hypothetical protein